LFVKFKEIIINVINVSHIALFLPSLEGGGAERVTVALANGFIKKGLSVDMVLAKVSGPYLKEISSEVRIINLKAGRVIFSLPGLVNYLKNERPQILFSTLEHASIFALWAKILSGNKVKCIIRFPNTIGVAARNAQSLRDRLIPWMTKFFIKWADAVVAVSYASAKDLVNSLHISSHRIHVIYNPVICDNLFEKAKEPLNHPWFASGQPPVILGVGRLSKQKDFSTLIRAFALVHKEIQVKLMILGEGAKRTELEKLIFKLRLEDDVALPGFIENPFPYMKLAKVFVLPSLWEGLPSTLIQAMALGTLVVATDCPGGSDEIIEGSKMGILVPVRDYQKLAVALIDQINKNETYGFEKIDRFKSEDIVNNYFRIINSL